MKIADMRELPRDELISEISKVREKIWKARFQAKGEPLENSGALKSLKKDVARLLTVLRETERTAGAARPGGSRRSRRREQLARGGAVVAVTSSKPAVGASAKENSSGEEA